MQKNRIEKLASERSQPCVTISMNTHRMLPNNYKDAIELEKLIKEAHQHVKDEFGHLDVNNLLRKIDNLADEMDASYNLESIHFFVSDSTLETIKSSWPISKNTVSVGENFVIKPLIKDLNRTEAYLIMVLSQSEVRLVKAINDNVSGDIKSEDFPFTENPYFLASQVNSSDGKQSDNLVREFFNQIDKALVKLHYKIEQKVVVICTDSNWSRLMQVADKPSIYYGNVSINDTAHQSLATEAWQVIVAIQEEGRKKAIHEMLEADGQGKVITDLLDIYLAVKAGRGELLIIHDDYHQAVKMNGQYSFYPVDDLTMPGVIDDITSEIAWEVISKKGRAVFTSQEEFKTLGNIALKVRY